MGMSTFKTPKVMSIYEENDEEIILPKGLFEKIEIEFDRIGVVYKISYDECYGENIDVDFKGVLKVEQNDACNNILSHNNGILYAVPGFGKTVVAANIICEKKCSTLILVNTKELAKQWVNRLLEFVDIKYNEVAVGKRKKTVVIGELNGSKNHLTGKIDVVLMQSMFEKDKIVKEFVDDYGLVIVDECHHITSPTYRILMQRLKSKYVYGLTATPIRKDGHHPIIKMYCGDIRYEKTVRAIKKDDAYKKTIVPRFTPCRKPVQYDHEKFEFQKINSFICENELRNTMIANDIKRLLEEKRKIMILTDRIAHINCLENLLDNRCNLISLHGGLKLKKRREVLEKIRNLKEDDETIIISVSKLIGEGFDLPQLDTLILASPISWKGRVLQYVGRLHRESKNKSELRIIDYVDIHIPVLEKMYFKRLKTYKSMGYSLKNEEYETALGDKLFFDESYLKCLIDDIENCKKSLVISIPSIKKKKFDYFKEKVFEAYHRGVKVVLIFKNMDDYSEKYKKYIVRIIKEIEKAGIDVMYKHNIESKFAILDDDLVWIGDTNTAIIRVFSTELSNELNRVINDLTE